MKKHIPSKTYLTEDEIPKQWYNIQADLPTPLEPPLNGTSHAPASPADLGVIFPTELLMQEMTTDRYVDIPKEIQEMYATFRPSPLCRAYQLEKALGTPAHIYYKYEGNNPSGSHKLNSALPQAYYNKVAGIKKLTTETGAGQWGTALATACSMFGIDLTVYMVKVSYEQKPFRKSIMQTFGAKVIASPSPTTESGRALLAAHPNTNGSLAMAIAEAVEVAAQNPDTNYALGSVLNHVALHQTIIGQEALKQFEKVDEYPDIVIACCGGGSNFAGLSFPFVYEKLKKGLNTRFIGVEPSACPSLTKGKYEYDFGDSSGFTPLLKMYTLGHDFAPSGIHAGGLRYHGMSPLVSRLLADGLMEARSVHQREVFEAAVLFAKSEFILPAPESAHAIKTTIDEALKCKETGEEKVILFNLSGHGYFDLTAYDEFNAGRMQDVELSQKDLEEGFNTIPKL